MAKKPKKLVDLTIDETSFVEQGANPGAKVILFKRHADVATDKAKATRTDDGVSYPAAAYAYTPDTSKPSTWKLRLWESPQLKETARQVGMAVAALGAGFRGNKVQIPAADLPKVKGKVRGAWKRTHPDAKASDVPTVLKYKLEDGTAFPVEAYASAPDADDPVNWSLRLWEHPDRESITSHLVGEALRSESFALSTDPAVTERITTAWQQLNPDAVELPAILKTRIGGPFNMDIQELEKRFSELEAQNVTLTEAVKAAEGRATTAETKVTNMGQDLHVAGLSEDCQKAFGALTEAEKAEYFEAKIDARKTMLDGKIAAMSKAAEVPEIIQKQLDDMKDAVAKADAKTEAAVKLAEAEVSARQRAEFAKQAEDSYSHLPGEPVAKGDVLMAIATLSEEVQKTLKTVLAAGNEALRVATKPAGTRGPAEGDNDGGGNWEVKAKAYAKEHKISVEKATNIVLQEDPELYNEYLKAKEG